MVTKAFRGEWLSKVPKNWKVITLKYYTRSIIDGAHFTPTYVSDDKAAPFLRVTDIHNDKIDLTKIKRIPWKEHWQLIKRCNPEKGDLLLSKNGTIGLMKIIDWDWEFSIFVSLCLIKFRKPLLNKFFFYFFQSNVVDEQIKESSKTTSVTNLHLEKIKELKLILPPLPEQKAIATYLDKKTAEIDRFIALKEETIALLKERKTAIINEAVTKGLDKDAKMKDSGIEWLGEIPEGWEVRRLASFGSFSKGGGISRADLKNNGLPAILYGDLYTKYNFKTDDTVNYISTDTAQMAKPINRGNLLFTGSGESKEEIGKCIVYLGNKTAYAGGDIIIFHQEAFNSSFLSYSFNSGMAIYQKIISAKGDIIVHTYASKLRNMIVAIPPIEEQDLIVKHIEFYSKKIDARGNYIEEEIRLIKEYRQSLISNVVTGKVDVRGME